MAGNLKRMCFSFSRILYDINLPQDRRFLTTCQTLYESKGEGRRKAKVYQIITLDNQFNRAKKDKESFVELIDVFKKKNYKTGVVEFIYVALKRMKEYGVHEDLEIYKKLIDLMPKGKMVASSWVLADIYYYPKHQLCITMVLLQMEENRVYPDRKLYDLLVSIFGKRSVPLSKYLRMQYWMPKFKNLSPWPHPKQGVPDKKEAAKLALKRMAELDLDNEITVFQTKEDPICSEDTWIASSQSPVQKKLVFYHPKNVPMFVEGPHMMYMGQKDRLQYFVLRSDLPQNRRRRQFRDPDLIQNLKIPFFDPPTPDDLIPDFSVHEQRDGIIFGMCVTGTNSKESLLSWIRSLQTNGNERLGEMTILFRTHLESNEDANSEADEDKVDDMKLLDFKKDEIKNTN